MLSFICSCRCFRQSQEICSIRLFPLFTKIATQKRKNPFRETEFVFVQMELVFTGNTAFCGMFYFNSFPHLAVPTLPACLIHLEQGKSSRRKNATGFSRVRGSALTPRSIQKDSLLVSRVLRRCSRLTEVVPWICEHTSPRLILIPLTNLFSLDLPMF